MLPFRQQIIVASGVPDIFRQNGHLAFLTLWIFLVAINHQLKHDDDHLNAVSRSIKDILPFFLNLDALSPFLV